MANKIEVNLATVNGGVDFALLVGKDPIYAYESGKKISDNPVGIKLILALQNARMAQLSVKFSQDPLPKVRDEEIAEATGGCKFLYVQIPDAIVTLFSGSNSNGIGMTATASSAQIVTLGK